MKRGLSQKGDKTSKKGAGGGNAPTRKRAGSESEKQRPAKARKVAHEQTAPVAANDGDEDFPRGGASVLTPLEIREAHKKADEDFLFEMDTKEEGKGKKKKKKGHADDALSDDDIAAVGTGKGKRIDTLSFKRLHSGLASMAAVREVHEHYMLLSLPCNLTGRVALTAVSPGLTKRLEAAVAKAQGHGDLEEVDAAEAAEAAAVSDLRTMFAVGMSVRCGVVSTQNLQGDKKKVELSLYPSVVNASLTFAGLQKGMMLWGSVESEEDHGYLVSFGDEHKFTGFLPNKQAKGVRLEVGLVRLFCANDLNRKTRVVSLTLADDTAAIPVEASAALKIENVMPGLLVEGTVKSTHENGLALTILDYFTATVDAFHLGLTAWQDPREVFQEGQKMLARVLYCDQENKSVGLSLNAEHVAGRMHAFPSWVKVGAIFDTVAIRRIDEGLGMLLEIPSSARPVKPEPGEEGASDVSGDSDDEGAAARAKKKKKKAKGAKATAATAEEDEDDLFGTGDGDLAGMEEGEEPAPIFAYVHISQAADARVEKLSKKFKVGRVVRCRVSGLSLLDGLVQVTLSKTALEQELMQYSDAKPGMLLTGSVRSVEPFGLIIALTDKIKGLCPLDHLADVQITHPEKKFKPGQRLQFRVLHVKPEEHKMMLTHKRTLLKTSLPLLRNYEDARPGSIVHGVITAVKQFGCIVTFYNDVHGLVPLAELSTQFVSHPESTFHVGQVMKTRVLSVDPVEEKLRLSFVLDPKDKIQKGRAAVDVKAYGALTLGAVVAGRVVSVSESALNVVTTAGIPGFIPRSHISDHINVAEQLLRTYAAGEAIAAMVVLEKDEERKRVVFSMKPALVAAAQSGELLASVEDAEVGHVYSGFVRSIAKFGCFVGFGGSLAGLAPLGHLSDGYVADAESVISVGQTVRARVESKDESGKLTLSLKASAVSPHDAEHLVSLLQARQRISEHTASDKPAPTVKAGDVVDAVVKTVKAYGIITELPDGSTGFTTTAQAAGVSHFPGTRLKGVVLDVDAAKAIVDVAFRPELLMAVTNAASESVAPTPKKKKGKTGARTLDVNTSVEAVVELVKDDYAVLTLPAFGHRVALAPARDYNAAKGSRFGLTAGQKRNGVVRMLAGGAGELPHCPIVVLEAPSGRSAGGAKVTSIESLRPGMRVTARVSKVQDLQMNVHLGTGVKGRVHVTEVLDDNTAKASAAALFAKYSEKDTVELKVLSTYDKESAKFLPVTHDVGDARKTVELTLRPRDLALPDGELAGARTDLAQLSKGQLVAGFVQSVSENGLWVVLSPSVRGRVFVLDVSNDLSVLEDLAKAYKPGQSVQCRVVTVDARKGSLDLSIKAAAKKTVEETLKVGNIIPARISQVVPGKGLSVQVSAHVYGKIGLTELSDDYTADPVKGHEVGQFISCAVLGVDMPNNHVDLSLRESRLAGARATGPCRGVYSAEEATPGEVVKGYVKSTTNKGCFVELGGQFVGRVLISNLSDDFIKDVKSAFPAGKLVTARVTAVDKEAGRVDLSLKISDVMPSNGPAVTMENLKEGQKVKAHVTKVETYGVFLRIDNSRVSGLCHISEALDKFVKDLAKHYKIGDPVKAVVLKVDREKSRVSFGLKSSYFGEDEGVSDEASEAEEEETAKPVAAKPAAAKAAKGKAAAQIADDSDGMEVEAAENGGDSDAEDASTLRRIMAQLGAGRATDVDSEGGEENTPQGMDIDSDDEEKEPVQMSTSTGFFWGAAPAPAAKATAESDDEEGAIDEEDLDAATTRGKDKSSKRKAAEEEERRIAEQEQALLDPDRLPESAQDFERMLLASPDSSFLWIKYMAFQLQQTEIDKARAVAERALKIISFREELERLNVWTALMNLESMHGSDESLQAVFARASQMNDPLKVHEQLVGIYEKAGKRGEAEALYKKMAKKFGKDSAHLWQRWGHFRLQGGDVDGAREVLQRALQSLPRQKHVQTIARFAVLEYKYGEPERGRTVFEELLSNYPKRTDLWSQYIDQEARSGDATHIRRLFERVTSMRMAPKKAKFLFTKWLQYEQEHGDETSQDHVKDRARAVMEARLAQGAEDE